MTPCSHHHACPRPRGVTLVELLLVLAILVVLSAMAIPLLDRPMANRKLRTAADSVRTEWCLARVEAMRSGRTLTFRHSRDGGRYCTEAQNDAAILEGGDEEESSSAESQDEAAVESAMTRSLADAKSLPEGVTFVACPAEAGTEPHEADSAEDDAGDWSYPIFFFPDGTTSDAQLGLRNDHGRAVELTLRGLTGTVTIGDPVSIEEPAQ